jgi:ATP-dependent protease HslVU (ClpYQ) peptidase subunit
VTVCIAAACDNGERLVTATDGLVSVGDVTGEAISGKMFWYGDWQFMYAGTPANFAMIEEEIVNVSLDDPTALSRRRVHETVRRAYQKVRARLASFDFLSPFDMTMEEFKKNGIKSFGESFHGETLRCISQRAGLLTDQLLLTGWGHSPYSVMIYEVGSYGDGLHTCTGFSAIGSGSQMAQTMLLLLGQSRHRTLAETIFNVACAKFSSEKSSGLDVGQHTSIFVSRKRSESDEVGRPPGDFLQQDEIQELRDLWNRHLRPRIPDESRLPIAKIAGRLSSGKTTLRDMAECVNASNRLRQGKVRIYEEISREVEQDRQSTTVEKSPPQPSQE